MQKDLSIAEDALKIAQALDPEYAEAYVEHSYSNGYAVEQGMLNSSSYIEDTGLRIRIIKDRNLYTFSTNILDKEGIKKLVNRFRNFKNGAVTSLSEEPVEKANYRVKEKKSIDSSDMMHDLLGIDKALREVKYVKFRSLYGGVGRSTTYFVNSEGSKISADIPMVSSFYSIIVGDGKETRQRMIQLGGTGGYELFNTSKIEDYLVEEAKKTYEVMKKGVTLSDSELKNIKNVVIGSEITGIGVHESVGHPNEADRVYGREAAQAGTSYLTKKNLGMRVGSDMVTIMDDPTIPNTYGFYLYDDEGVKAKPKTIIENGIQKELLDNREYAHTLGKHSNASARSDGYSNEPLVRMSNTYLKRGDASFEELIETARQGAYIKSFMEWNIDDTRSFERYQGSESYVIKNGRLDKPIKNFKIETTTLNFWGSVALVGKDFKLAVANCGKGEPMQGVPVCHGGPSVLLSFG